jgi:hypothetical protein
MDLNVYDYDAGQMPISVYFFKASVTTSGPENLISVYTRQIPIGE